MPLKLEPNQTFDVCLDIDKDKPADTRPVFEVRVLSVREQRKISAALEKAMQAETTDGYYDGLVDLIDDVVTGWRNMGQDYSKEALEDVLVHVEMRELLAKIQVGQAMTEDEKKSSE